MITKSNYYMLKNLNFKPKGFGILDGKEVEYLRKHFQIDERSNVDLQNLRDFVVMYFEDKTRNSMEQYDIMSGIVGVIDEEKYSRGLEV